MRVLLLVEVDVRATSFGASCVPSDSAFNKDDRLWHVVLVDAIDDLHDPEVFLGVLPVAHPARHVVPREDTARVGTSGNGTNAPMMLRSVGHGTLLVAIPANGAHESLALGSAVHVYEVALLKDLGWDHFLANLPLLPVLRPNTELLQLLHWREVIVLQRPDHWAELLHVLLVRHEAVIADLHGVVAMPLWPLLLRHNVAASLDHEDGAWHLLPFSIALFEDASHVELLGPDADPRLQSRLHEAIPPWNCLIRSSRN
mmetsp:Transcript_46856/g.101740  ORF Transcript_46856/g.101740 Transcript_46856/m.101740 type:complete len:257 (-) Transcript_46856:353-1123(-)